MNPLRNPVTWFEIYVNDLPRAKAFYEAVLGIELTPEASPGDFEAYRFPGGMPGFGAMGALMKHPKRLPSVQGTLVYFHVDDCAVVLERARVLGAPIHRDKWSIGADGFIAIIGDLHGNAIGLHSFG